MNNIRYYIQKLLFEEPLYKYISDNLRVLNILCVGDGEAAETFIDLCLQLGQMRNTALKIRSCTVNANEFKSRYLEARPAMSEFVEMDGKPVTGSEIYAKLDFFEPVYHGETDYLSALYDEMVYHWADYVFVATGDVELDTRLTEQINRQIAGFKGKSFCTGMNELLLKPVEVNHELERMAFNVHTVWNGNVNTGLDELWESFLEEYNHASSISYAISIGYRLYTAGINMSDPFEAAKAFYELLNEDDSYEEKLVGRLAADEHKRWIMEKVCDGWSAPKNAKGEPDYKGCIARGSVKDPVNKTHPCIIVSSPGNPLAGEEFTKNNHAAWNRIDIKSAGLDELDTMSVTLHRNMRSHAIAVRKQKPLEGESFLELALIINRICADKEAAELEGSFKKYRYYIRNILDGSRTCAEQFGDCVNMLKAAIKQASKTKLMSGKDALRASELIDKIKLELFAVIENNLYRNYKQYDIDLIRRIPYILTYSRTWTIGAVYDDATDLCEDNNTLVKNVAAAAIIKPEAIHYVYYYTGDSTPAILAQRITGTREFFERRKLNTEISFFVATSVRVNRKEVLELGKVLSGLKKTRIIDDFDICDSCDDAMATEYFITSMIKSRIKYFDGSGRLMCSNYYETKFVNDMNYYCPYFEFNPSQSEFSVTVNCDELKYIDTGVYLKLEDVLGIMGGVRTGCTSPDCYDIYEKLWSVYIGEYNQNLSFIEAVENWNRFCDTLARKIGGREAGRLDVSDFEIQDEGQQNIINALEQAGALKVEKLSSAKADFRVVSEEIKKILIKSGEILEIYTYFKCVEEGCFDEVATSFEFAWKNEDEENLMVSNELDVVLTKGFKTIAIECKGRKGISQDYFHRLQTVNSKFGISAVKIVIALKSDDEIHQREFKRAEAMDIITITDKQDIVNIGKTVRKILKL